MDFILRYRGRLPGKKGGTVDDKQYVRMKLHPQLEELCRREHFFEDCLYPHLLTGHVTNKRLEFNHDEANPANDKQFCRVPLGGFEFVPLIHRQHLPVLPVGHNLASPGTGRRHSNRWRSRQSFKGFVRRPKDAAYRQ